MTLDFRSQKSFNSLKKKRKQWNINYWKCITISWSCLRKNLLTDLLFNKNTAADLIKNKVILNISIYIINLFENLKQYQLYRNWTIKDPGKILNVGITRSARELPKINLLGMWMSHVVRNSVQSKKILDLLRLVHRTSLQWRINVTVQKLFLI